MTCSWWLHCITHWSLRKSLRGPSAKGRGTLGDGDGRESPELALFRQAIGALQPIPRHCKANRLHGQAIGAKLVQIGSVLMSCTAHCAASQLIVEHLTSPSDERKKPPDQRKNGNDGL